MVYSISVYDYAFKILPLTHFFIFFFQVWYMLLCFVLFYINQNYQSFWLILYLFFLAQVVGCGRKSCWNGSKPLEGKMTTKGSTSLSLDILTPNMPDVFPFSELGHISKISSAYHVLPFTVFTRSGQRRRKKKKQTSILGNDLKTTPCGRSSMSQIHKARLSNIYQKTVPGYCTQGGRDAW